MFAPCPLPLPRAVCSAADLHRPPTDPDLFGTNAGIILAAFLGGTMNAIAGGGTLITFPALVGFGVTPIVANATSTVALWPGLVGAMWGYRGELKGARRWAIRFAAPSVAGGLTGALLLLATPADRFEDLVPWLVFCATLLFVVQRPLMRLVRSGRSSTAVLSTDTAADEGSGPLPAKLVFYQYMVGVYGGYFGAGIGILMLAAFGFMGFTNIHRMNGLKNWGALCMNMPAATIFAASSLVDWPVAVAMAVGSVAGGYIGSRTAQRVPQEWVRRAIIVIGLSSAVWLALRQG
jgi:uncharacterized membrane protein YfcA